MEAWGERRVRVACQPSGGRTVEVYRGEGLGIKHDIMRVMKTHTISGNIDGKSCLTGIENSSLLHIKFNIPASSTSGSCFFCCSAAPGVPRMGGRAALESGAEKGIAD